MGLIIIQGNECCIFDNNDGLDLYVTNYVDYSIDNNPECTSPYNTQNMVNYLQGLIAILMSSLVLKINFIITRMVSSLTDLTTGIGRYRLREWELYQDVDNDGDMDIYVANDKDMNLYSSIMVEGDLLKVHYSWGWL